MSFTAPDYRYNPFSQTITSYGHGYSGNPKEEYIIPSVAPYYVYLNEIPRDDNPSTLLINEKAGSNFAEVSFATSPAAGQFRAVYGGDESAPISIVGQGTIEFNSADAGKTLEIAYYGMGAIVQNQLFNKLLDGFYGSPSFGAGLLTTTVKNLANDDNSQIINVAASAEFFSGELVNGVRIMGRRYTGSLPATPTSTGGAVLGGNQYTVILASSATTIGNLYRIEGQITTTIGNSKIPVSGIGIANSGVVVTGITFDGGGVTDILLYVETTAAAAQLNSSQYDVVIYYKEP